MSVDTSHRRAFRLLVEPDGDKYGVRLEQTNGSPRAPPVAVATLDSDRTSHVAQPVVQAVKRSGHQATALSPSRRKPLQLSEDEGVRLALVLLALTRSSRWQQVERVVAGVAAMGTEETYYWYAKCMGSEPRRARRALRILVGGADK